MNILDNSNITYSVMLSVIILFHLDALLVSLTPVTQKNSKRVSVNGVAHIFTLWWVPLKCECIVPVNMDISLQFSIMEEVNYQAFF